MTSEKRNIKDILGEIEDFRRDNKNKRHDLVDILVIALCGMISGAEDWVSIERYALLKKDFFSQFLRLPNGIPSHDTFNRVFMMLDADELTLKFREWVLSVLPEGDQKHVAIDGKTLRRSFSNGDKKTAIHMVNAWFTEHHMSLGQLKTQKKSNEITAIPELIETLMLEGCVVTMDAMECQKKIVDKIVSKKAHYCLAVKNNQPTLYAEIEAFFDNKKPKNYCRPKVDYHEVRETKSGKLNVRRYWASESLGSISSSDNWLNLCQIICAEREIIDGSVNHIEKRYFITDLDNSAETLSSIIRNHWGIENSLHWVLDVAFREDDCRVRVGNGAENLSRLRQMALGLLKQETSIKLGIKNKRLSAGWDNDYLMKVLGVL